MSGDNLNDIVRYTTPLIELLKQLLGKEKTFSFCKTFVFNFTEIKLNYHKSPINEMMCSPTRISNENELPLIDKMIDILHAWPGVQYSRGGGGCNRRYLTGIILWVCSFRLMTFVVTIHTPSV